MYLRPVTVASLAFHLLDSTPVVGSKGIFESLGHDALQDAFIRAIANWNAFQVVEDAAAWIFSTLRNRLVDLWCGRDARRRAGAVELSPEILEEIAVAAGLGPAAELLRDGLAAVGAEILGSMT